MKIKTSTYIIDPIFPTREIHIIAGPSGAGKSTLLGQLADALIKGTEVFGYTPNPVSGIAYLAFDRSEKGMGRTFERTLEQAETPFPFYSTVNSPEFADHKDPIRAVKRLKELHPEVDLLILDGIGVAFKGDSSKINDVAEFIHSLLRALDKMSSDLTIFAIHHTSKQKKGNEYSSARAKLHGSVAWAATAETIILVDCEDDEDPENPNRTITICPRNAPERKYVYCFDEFGRLIPGAKLLDPTVAKKKAFYILVIARGPGDFTFAQFKDLAKDSGVSEATLKRWLSEWCESGDARIQKTRHGVYTILPETIN